MCWPSFRKRKTPSPPVIVNIVDDEYIVDFCFRWNIKYPIDRWWRDKHKVAFNSPEHRSVSFVDMRIEFEEDQVFRRNAELNLYIPNKGEFMKKTIMSDSDLTEEEKLIKYREEFKQMDLTQFDDK